MDPLGVIADEDSPHRVVLSDEEFRKVELSPELRRMLRNPRLERCIRFIVESPDRRAALDRALLNPQLREFVDALLVTLGKGSRRPDGSVEFSG